MTLRFVQDEPIGVRHIRHYVSAVRVLRGSHHKCPKQRHDRDVRGIHGKVAPGADPEDVCYQCTLITRAFLPATISERSHHCGITLRLGTQKPLWVKRLGIGVIIFIMHNRPSGRVVSQL